jgi:hypothetical protein
MCVFLFDMGLKEYFVGIRFPHEYHFEFHFQATN